jgi:transposase
LVLEEGVSFMPRASKYPPEFRDRCIRIARESERPIAAVARDLGVHPETLRLWVRHDEADDGTRSDRLTTAEREELTALRRECKDLRRSNEILKAASVFFARELDQPRPR